MKYEYENEFMKLSSHYVMSAPEFEVRATSRKQGKKWNFEYFSLPSSLSIHVFIAKKEILF